MSTSDSRYVLTLRKRLKDQDVHDLVQESIELISATQNQIDLPISPHIKDTARRLRNGNFKAGNINSRKSKTYAMEFGSFNPPATIILDKKLPLIDRPLNLPDFTQTMTVYSAVHEVIHADDHTGGDELLIATQLHILKQHRDKLEKGMEIIVDEGGCVSIQDFKDLAGLWAVQYVDMVTHYRAYVVLRQHKFPKLEEVWSRLNTDYFPPNLLTCIELEKGVKYVFNLFTERMGEYCLIEALDDFKKIKEKNACSYTV